MIRVTARAGELVQRLRKRAARIAAGHAAEQRKRAVSRRADWHSASALWPDLFGDRRDGK
jgi:hypothetical protein